MKEVAGSVLVSLEAQDNFSLDELKSIVDCNGQ